MLHDGSAEGVNGQNDDFSLDRGVLFRRAMLEMGSCDKDDEKRVGMMRGGQGGVGMDSRVDDSRPASDDSRTGGEG